MERLEMGMIGLKERRDVNWDCSGRNVISHIIVIFDNQGVKGISFGFVENGFVVMSKVYGSSSTVNGSRRIVWLNHETEFVTGISGETYCRYITSLTFHTNQRKHETVHIPFDPKYDIPFKKEFVSEMLDRRDFGGFFGSCNACKLTSIGFYVSLVLSDEKDIKLEN